MKFMMISKIIFILVAMSKIIPMSPSDPIKCRDAESFFSEKKYNLKKITKPTNLPIFLNSIISNLISR